MSNENDALIGLVIVVGVFALLGAAIVLDAVLTPGPTKKKRAKRRR